MIRLARLLAAPAALALLVAGCAESTDTELSETPPEVVEPVPAAADVDAEGPDDEPGLSAAMPDAYAAEETAAEPAEDADAIEPAVPAEEPAAEAEAPAEPAEEPAAEAEAEPADADQAAVTLKPITYEALLEAIAAEDAKLTLVDCWASWCEPCKENFDHVLEMADAYGDKGLRVVALSFDAGNDVPNIDEKQIADAEAFLAEKGVEGIDAYRLDHKVYEMFEAFKINTIPAVFLYDAEGKEVGRFTWDDPRDQFTYPEVEQAVAERLGVEPAGVIAAE